MTASAIVTAALLDVRDVAAGYGDVDILDGVSLRVGEGEIVTIIGPNDAGKINYDGASGPCDFDDNGDLLTKSFYVFQIKAGKLEKVGLLKG